MPHAVPTTRIVQADWLDFAPTLAPASVDLVYADPPFNTGLTQRGRAGAYEDWWESTGAWVAWLRERLAATLPALKPTGSVLLHVDWRTSHHARLLLDELLGPDRFVNHLVWAYGLGGSSARRFARKHDDILFYGLDPDRYWFEAPRVPATSRRMRGKTKKATSVLRVDGDAATKGREGGDEATDEADGDVLDVPAINNMARERVGWPTQKPLALLEMLIRACCPPGGVVLDPCCGSGTTIVAAERTGRIGVGCDVSPEAVATARARLESLRADEPAPR